jgi:hypothetical protein
MDLYLELQMKLNIIRFKTKSPNQLAIVAPKGKQTRQAVFF